MHDQTNPIPENLTLTPALPLECRLWEDDINTDGRVDTLFEGYAKAL